MRLIDADVVMQLFIQESEYSGVNVVHINTIKRILKDIDTAYNVDKVVEELEMLSTEVKMTLPLVKDAIETKVIASEDAIKIIRRGGVE